MMRVFKNNRGMSLMGVMVAVGISSIAMMAMTSQMKLVGQMMRKQSMVDSIEMIRAQVKSTILSEDAWNNTVTHSTNTDELACLSGSGCSALEDIETPINLIDAGDNILVNTKASREGFTMQGASCGTFPSGDDVDDTCPIKLRITWKPFCGVNDGGCTKPLVHISGVFEYKGSPVLGNLDVSRFSLDMIREQEFENVDDTIERNLASVSSCPNNQKFMGFTPEGKKICQTDLAKTIASQGSCRSGYYLIGYDSRGRKKCRREKTSTKTTVVKKTTVNKTTTGSSCKKCTQRGKTCGYNQPVCTCSGVLVCP